MVAPLIIAGVALAGIGISAAANIYSAYKQKGAADYTVSYQDALMRENARYWGDYYKNTGFSPVYPMRSGFVFNESALRGAQASSDVAYAHAIGSTAGLAGASMGIYGAYARGSYGYGTVFSQSSSNYANMYR